jgi:hypothetical protein
VKGTEVNAGMVVLAWGRSILDLGIAAPTSSNPQPTTGLFGYVGRLNLSLLAYAWINIISQGVRSLTLE